MEEAAPAPAVSMPGGKPMEGGHRQVGERGGRRSEEDLVQASQRALKRGGILNAVRTRAKIESRRVGWGVEGLWAWKKAEVWCPDHGVWGRGKERSV